MKVQAYYKQFTQLLNQLPKENESWSVNNSIADDYNSKVDQLAINLQMDLSLYKASQEQNHLNNIYCYRTLPFRIKLASLIGMLEGEFDIQTTNETEMIFSQKQPQIAIINNNTIALTINSSLQQIIDKEESNEAKDNLSKLKDELQKKDKNWSKIKTILIWALNFSEKLFFQLLPILLKQYGLGNV